MQMEHHTHEHINSNLLKDTGKALYIGIALNLIFALVEIATGYWQNSLALISDAGHNLTDVGGLIISLVAFKVSSIKPNSKYSYGFQKSTILASLLNSLLLITTVGAIIYNAISRFSKPLVVSGDTIALVATIGIFVNTISALLFLKSKNHDLNAKGAYMHLFADALVSLGVVVGGIIIHFTHFEWIDPLLSIVIGIVIFWGTYGILRESLKLSIDAVPIQHNLEEIKKLIAQHKNVKEVHHLHIWAMSTTLSAMTVHLVLEDNLSNQLITETKDSIKLHMKHLNINHVTIETDFSQTTIIENCN